MRVIIAQITDAHVARPGTRLYGGYDPQAALARTLAALAALEPRPDIVLFTGDLTADGQPEEYATCRALLEDCGLAVVAIPGNHDRRAAFVEAFAGSAVRIGSGPFLHLVIEDQPLRLIGLDTLGADGASRGLLCHDRLDWLEATLAAAPERPTLVFMHHPPFATGIDFMDAIGCEGGDRLAVLLAGRRNLVRVICGHVHRAVETGFAGTIGSVCPAIAWEVPLRLGPSVPTGMVPQPPAFQLHVWRGNGGLVTHTVRLPA